MFQVYIVTHLPFLAVGTLDVHIRMLIWYAVLSFVQLLLLRLEHSVVVWAVSVLAGKKRSRISVLLGRSNSQKIIYGLFSEGKYTVS